jgi:hypothetical protein
VGAEVSDIGDLREAGYDAMVAAKLDHTRCQEYGG